MLVKRIRKRRHRRRGAVLILAAAIFVVVLGLAALALDLGYICLEDAKCQNAADAAALAGAISLADNRGDSDLARETAIEYAEANVPDGGDVLLEQDVTFGTWDVHTGTFVEDEGSPNAIRVVVKRAESNDNELQLFFGPIMGEKNASISATAIVMLPPPGGPQFRFLLDNEIIDKDIGDIEDLADRLGVDGDVLLSDNDGDGFIELPAGEQLWVPTGQITTSTGLIDVSAYGDAWPFGDETAYTATEFIKYDTALETLDMENIEWGKDGAPAAPHPDLDGKKILDPGLGTAPMSVHQDIRDLADNPDQVYMSPVYKSSISVNDWIEGGLVPEPEYGSPYANLQGERRGLIAFKILAYRDSVAGTGSYNQGDEYLPDVKIEILEPTSIEWGAMSTEGGSGGGGIGLVR